jgi:hypothetical protein
MAETTTITEMYRRRLTELKDEITNEGWLGLYRELSDYMSPRRGQYLSNDTKDTKPGSKKESKIINGSANDALRIIAAGLQGGLTSPARPWFKLGFADADLMEFGPVRDWAYKVRERMLYVFARSNFYGAMHGQYGELALFGTSAMLIEEDFRTTLRCRPFTIGEYMLACDSQYRVNTLYRQFSSTARQMIDEFGKDNVSDPVKEAVKNGNLGRRFELIHLIQPNGSFDENKRNVDGKKFESVYFELNADHDKLLRRAGYEDLPIAAARWDVTGVSVYGNAPGMTALGDVKMLQKMEEKKLKALDKMVDPPMNAPSSMKGKGGTIISGGVNYIDVAQGNQGFTPTFMVNPDFQKIAFEIDRVEQRIRRFFFNDLFLSVLNEDKRMTATEVAKRHEEKLVVLGPVIERLQSEVLDNIIDRTFEIMLKQDMIPPPPKEIAGMGLKVEYIGLLAQAQKIVGTTAIESVANFAAALAPVVPSILDKFDADEAMDQYGDMLGVAPNVIRSDDEVEKVRASRAQAEQAAQTAANAQPMAQMATAAKTASETVAPGGGNMLEMLMGGAQQ